MKKITTRFGEVEYDPAQTIFFPEGFVGLEHLKSFIVMPNEKNKPLFWLQNINDPDFAFVVTDPTNFFPNYEVGLGPEEYKLLQISEDDELYILSIVTITPDKKITLNLTAPLFFSPKTNRGVQTILENSPYDVRTPLPEN